VASTEYSLNWRKRKVDICSKEKLTERDQKRTIKAGEELLKRKIAKKHVGLR